MPHGILPISDMVRIRLNFADYIFLQERKSYALAFFYRHNTIL